MKSKITTHLLALTVGTIFFVNSIFIADAATNELFDLNTKAMDAFKQGNYELAIAYFGKIIQLNSNNADGYCGRGEVFSYEKKYAEAIADLNESIRLKPSAYAYAFRGEAYSQKKDTAKALEDYTESIKLNPNNGKVYFLRAKQYFHLHYFVAALADCNTAILILSDAPDTDGSLEMAYFYRGGVFNNMRKFDRASDDFTKVIQISPTNATPYNLRGWACLWMGKYDKAIEDFKKSIQLNPKDELPYRRLAWIMATCPDEKYRDGQKALENSKKACELTAWKEPLDLITIAAAYAELGNFEQSVIWEQKAIELGLKDQDSKDSQERLELYKQKKPFRIKMPIMTK